MFNSEVLSRKIAFKIANELNLDNDNKEVIAYGIFAAIQMIYNIVFVILIGAMFNVVIESLIVSFTIAILRKSSGGVHASSPERCLVIGSIVCIIISLIAKIDISINEIIIIGIGIFLWSYYIAWKFAPVDSPAKPIKSEKKRNRLRNGSVINLAVYMIIVSMGLVIYKFTNINTILVYIVCIYGGVIWQMLSLTNIGHIIVKVIDYFLNKLTIRGNRGE